MIWSYSLLIIPAYLFGTIPFSVFVAKAAGHDIYHEGSKNPGASNVARIAGWKWGLLAMLLDVLKGFIPTVLALVILPSLISLEQTRLIAYLCALGAVLGHVVPIKRKGGKGIATAGGAVIALYPIGGVLVAIVWFALMKLTKLPVVSSLIAAVIFGIYVTLFKIYTWEIYINYGLVLLLIITHIPNIKRLINGSESKVLQQENKDN